MEKSENGSERRKRFFPTVSLGNIIAILAFAGSAIGIYTQLYAEVKNNAIEITAAKADAIKQEQQARDSRQEIRQDIRDVKTDVKI
jgi:hypothetical protein